MKWCFTLLAPQLFFLKPLFLVPLFEPIKLLIKPTLKIIFYNYNTPKLNYNYEH